MKKKPPPKPTPAKRKLAREIERVMIPPTRESLLDSLRQITPGAFADGKLDLRRLAEMTGVDDGGSERYRFDWAGRPKAEKVLQAPPMGALIPHRNESENFDSTRNLYIEGENLGAMKLLHPAYAGRVKMIYIDPPYNTGSDFIYKDDYSCPLRVYWELCKELNSKGEVNSAKAKDEEKKVNGHSHSHWLSMMYPRLMQARTLLRDDGVIFVSIDDNEVHHLRLLMNRVFGENCVDCFVWQKSGDGRYGKMKNVQTFRKDHEYILVAFRDAQMLNKLWDKPDYKTEYGNPDNDSRGDYKAGSISKRESASNPNHENFYTVIAPSGREITRQFDISEQEFKDLNEDGRIFWGKDGNAVPAIKIFLEEKRFVTPSSMLLNKGSTYSGTKDLENLFSGIEIAAEKLRPKPRELIKTLVQLATNPNSIVLDFFSGSATTAHAVMELNAEDGGNRRCISIQIPESCDANSEAAKSGYKTIADIGKERIRRAAEKIREQNKAADIDLGFRIFQLARSNFQQWQPPAEKTADEWKKATEKMTLPLSSADTEAMLFEIMLAEGYPPDSAVEKVRAKDNAVHKISHPDGDRVMHVCLDKKLVEGIPDALGIGEDDKFICRDDALNDILATNLALRCKVKVV